MANSAPNFYEPLLKWATTFQKTYQPTPVDGEIYDQPGTAVYMNAKQKLETGGRIEINIITPEASDGFAWQVEITIDDAANQLFQHMLLQRDGTIVETYGKTVIPIDDEDAEATLDRLNRLMPL